MKLVVSESLSDSSKESALFSPHFFRMSTARLEETPLCASCSGISIPFKFLVGYLAGLADRPPPAGETGSAGRAHSAPPRVADAPNSTSAESLLSFALHRGKRTRPGALSSRGPSFRSVMERNVLYAGPGGKGKWAPAAWPVQGSEGSENKNATRGLAGAPKIRVLRSK